MISYLVDASYRSWLSRQKGGKKVSAPKGRRLRIGRIPRPLIVVLVVIASSFVLAALAFGAGYLWISRPVPIPEIRAESIAQTTHIYAADGSVLATLRGEINRKPIPLERMPAYLPKLVAAAEDARFFTRGAVDYRATLRAALVDLQAGEYVQGASTITQQYVKDAYVGKRRTLARKIQEARVAYQLERRFSKHQILERYLNTVYFGRGAYGIEAAADTYFNKPAANLTVSESSLLVGLIPAPVRYSPYDNPKRAEARRLAMIGRAEKRDAIDHEAAEQARKEQPAVAELKEEPVKSPWFVDTVRRYLFRRYGTDKVLTGGLNVYTTLDPKMQREAQEAIKRGLPDPADPHASLVSIDPKTGYVKAIIGGRNEEERFNLAIQARRQTGSAFKPFVLVAALEKGISPTATYSGPSSICLRGWIPDCHVSNFGGSGFGRITLERATWNSVNTVYAQLIMQVGPKKVVDVARRMGIPGPGELLPVQYGCRPLGSDICRTKLPSVPSIALGAGDVTPLEMASAFSTLASGGVYRAPKLVSRVVDRSGRVLEAGPSKPVQAIKPEVAKTATEILSGVITRGTGRRADIGRPAAGKTGTSQDFGNAWFVGYTPELATAFWMGYRDTNAPMLNLHGFKQIVGGSIPAQAWADYMSLALDTKPPTIALEGGLADGAPSNAPSYGGAAADPDGVVERVEVSVDGKDFIPDGVTCTGCPGPSVAWSFTPVEALPDGNHTIRFRSVDRAGNHAKPVGRKVLVDTVVPTFDSVTAAGARLIVTGTFSEALSCSSVDFSDFAVTIGGLPVGVNRATCVGGSGKVVELTLGVAPRGGDPVSVTAVGVVADPAGNALATPATLSIGATNVGPSLTIGSPSLDGSAAIAPTFTGTAADHDGGVERIEVSIDGGDFTGLGIVCAGCPGRSVTWTFTPPPEVHDGYHLFTFDSIDNAGRSSPMVSRTVIIDTAAPTLEEIKATGDSTTVMATFSEPVECSTLSFNDFTAAIEDDIVSVVYAGCRKGPATTIEIQLRRAPKAGESVVIFLTGVVADTAGNTAPAPAIRSAIAADPENPDQPRAQQQAGRQPTSGAQARSRR